MVADRAMLFVDGSNWYHSLRKLDLTDLGRLEPRSVKNAAAAELKQYLNQLPIQVDRGVYRDLMDLANRHAKTQVMVEEAVDVMLAVDLVVMAERDEYAAAYILSADGDYTPACEQAPGNTEVQVRAEEAFDARPAGRRPGC